MSNITPFDWDNREHFEEMSKENGFLFWYARDLMAKLGYDDYSKFRSAIERAMTACISLQIPVEENFTSIERDIENIVCKDYKLSRFACYLTAMNGDTKKAEIAKAQAFFISQAESFRNYINSIKNIDRIITRDEITGREKSLSGVVKRAGIENYPLFQNAGYRGLYNMNIGQLKKLRGVKKGESTLDYMGKTELAANLFRITQTEEKIKNENIFGQKDLEDTAEEVGKQVRNTIQKISKTNPEYLPKEEDIKKVKKGIKGSYKEFKKNR